MTTTATPGTTGTAGDRPALTDDELRRIDAYWRAANYLSVGPDLPARQPAAARAAAARARQAAAARPLGHDAGPQLHLRAPQPGHQGARPRRDLHHRAGPRRPGHGRQRLPRGHLQRGLPVRSPATRTGMRRLFRQFSFPGGIPSHVAPETPGSIHEGGELGYALSHAYGAAFDNPDLVVCCVVGDGEAETGPLAASWHSNKFLDPVTRRRGAADPPPQRLQDRQPDGARPHPARGAERAARGLRLHARTSSRATTRPRCTSRWPRRSTRSLDEIARDPARGARADGVTERPRWPMIVLRTPKGWTGPEGGRRQAGRGHLALAPGADGRGPRQRRAPAPVLEAWLRSATGPRSCSTTTARSCPELAELAPRGRPADERQPARQRRACCSATCALPDFRDYAVDVAAPGRDHAPRRPACSARFLRDVIGAQPGTNFRLFGPDETASNRLGAVLEVDRQGVDGRDRCRPTSTSRPTAGSWRSSPSTTCQGWLEGYLLTGRHGLFNCYEAFIHIVDSMFNQHAKWLKVTRDIPWRRPIASLNYLLSSPRLAPGPQRLHPPGPGLHRPRRQQEGRRHPGLPAARREHPAVGRRPLPAQPELRQRHRGRQAARARTGCRWTRRSSTARAGIGIWEWASNDQGGEPDVVLGLRRRRPDARDAGRRRPAPPAPARPEGPGRQRRRPDAAPDRATSTRTACPTPSSTRCSPTDRPVVFAYHGYPWLIHRLTYRRTNHANLHVRGYKEEGTTTTPFDMVMLNDLDRFHLVMDVIDRVPGLGAAGRARAPADGRQAARGPRLHPRAGRGRARDPRLDLAGAERRAGPGTRILVVNAGSSSLKLRVLDAGRRGRRRGGPAAARRCRRRGEPSRRRSRRSGEVDAVGHRVVHGGTRFTAPVRRRRRRARRRSAS